MCTYGFAGTQPLLHGFHVFNTGNRVPIPFVEVFWCAAAPCCVLHAGPTATGKSSVALALCKDLGGEIVSCDSVQVYRDVFIGCNKPSAEEMREVRHHLVDVAALDETFTAGNYLPISVPPGRSTGRCRFYLQHTVVDGVTLQVRLCRLEPEQIGGLLEQKRLRPPPLPLPANQHSVQVNS